MSSSSSSKSASDRNKKFKALMKTMGSKSSEELAWEGKEEALKKMKAAMDAQGGVAAVTKASKGFGGLNGWITGYAGDLRNAGPGKRLDARYATLLASSKNYGKDVGSKTPLSKTHDYLLGKLTVEGVLGNKPKWRAKAR